MGIYLLHAHTSLTMDTALLLIKTGHVLSLTDIYTIDHSCSNKCTKELSYPIGYHLITEEREGREGEGGKREREGEREGERERSHKTRRNHEYYLNSEL